MKGSLRLASSMYRSRSGRPERRGFPETTQLVRGSVPATKSSPASLPAGLSHLQPALCPEPRVPPSSPAPSLPLGLAMMLFLLFLDVLSSRANKIKSSSGGYVCHCEERSAFHRGCGPQPSLCPQPQLLICDVRTLSQPTSGERSPAEEAWCQAELHHEN